MPELISPAISKWQQMTPIEKSQPVTLRPPYVGLDACS